MSLKALHIVFVIAATLLTAGLAVWFIRNHAETKQTTDLVLGISSAVSSLVLVVYGRAVYKKLKNISYL